MMDSGMATVDPEIDRKIGEIYRQDAKIRQENAERRESKSLNSFSILASSLPLPPLCELGVLAVKFFDFED
jgi:hypothetical protein